MTLLLPALERARWGPGGACSVPAACAGLAASLGLAGRVLSADPTGDVRAGADGNRSLLLPDVTASLDGPPLYLSVKGVGALTPMYGEVGWPTRRFTGETWYGEAPFGGQGQVNAARGLDLTERAGGTTSIHGFRICPVVQVVEVPEAAVHRDEYWYRRFRGPVLQEHRLVPSDVRLFHAAEHTLGQDPARVLAAFGEPDLDTFLDNLLRSGLAALTVWARTARETPHGLSGLGYFNVWLDKDSVVAPDGTLYFADLEGLDEQLAAPGLATVDERVRDQFEHNLYELLFAVDLVQRLHENRVGRVLSAAARRRKVAARVELALVDDPVLETVSRPEGLSLLVKPIVPTPPVLLPLFDL